jgi:hypothetical protein
MPKEGKCPECRGIIKQGQTELNRFTKTHPKMGERHREVAIAV